MWNSARAYSNKRQMHWTKSVHWMRTLSATYGACEAHGVHTLTKCCSGETTRWYWNANRCAFWQISCMSEKEKGTVTVLKPFLMFFNNMPCCAIKKTCSAVLHIYRPHTDPSGYGTLVADVHVLRTTGCKCAHLKNLLRCEQRCFIHDKNFPSIFDLSPYL